MITQPLGFPNFYYYTNFGPVFDQMKTFTESYSHLLQSNDKLPGPRTSPLPSQPRIGQRVHEAA